MCVCVRMRESESESVSAMDRNNNNNNKRLRGGACVCAVVCTLWHRWMSTRRREHVVACQQDLHLYLHTDTGGWHHHTDLARSLSLSLSLSSLSLLLSPTLSVSVHTASTAHVDPHLPFPLGTQKLCSCLRAHFFLYTFFFICVKQKAQLRPVRR